MMQWTEDLTVNVAIIDSQHKELIEKVNELINAATSGEKTDYIRNLFAFLESYVVHHFGAEETIMKKLSYPDTLSHKAEHTAFISKLQVMKDEFVKGKTGTAFAAKVQIELCTWLIHHIRRIDKELGKFINNSGQMAA